MPRESFRSMVARHLAHLCWRLSRRYRVRRIIERLA